MTKVLTKLPIIEDPVKLAAMKRILKVINDVHWREPLADDEMAYLLLNLAVHFATPMETPNRNDHLFKRVKELIMVIWGEEITPEHTLFNVH